MEVMQQFAPTALAFGEDCIWYMANEMYKQAWDKNRKGTKFQDISVNCWQANSKVTACNRMMHESSNLLIAHATFQEAQWLTVRIHGRHERFLGSKWHELLPLKTRYIQVVLSVSS